MINLGLRSPLKDFSRKLTFKVVTKTIDDFVVKESERVLNFVGVWTQLSPTELLIKPESQRDWRWYSCHTDPKIDLSLDSVVEFEGTNYRVKTKDDYRAYGFIKYGLVEDYTSD